MKRATIWEIGLQGHNTRRCLTTGMGVDALASFCEAIGISLPVADLGACFSLQFSVGRRGDMGTRDFELIYEDDLDTTGIRSGGLTGGPLPPEPAEWPLAASATRAPVDEAGFVGAQDAARRETQAFIERNRALSGQ